MNGAGELVALATRAMVKDARSFPSPGAPSVDSEGRLRVGAAVGTREDDKQRVARLYEAGKVGGLGRGEHPFLDINRLQISSGFFVR